MTAMAANVNIVEDHHCQKILGKYLKSQDFEIIDFNVKSLAGTVTGMMAEYYTLTINFTAKGKSETKLFFCKKLAMFHKIQEIMGRAQGAFEKEDFIYSFLVKECRKIPHYVIDFAPECYLSLPHELFVLDDLSAENYKVAPVKHDLNHLKMALKSIAKFHATSVVYEEKMSILKGRKYSLYDEFKDVFADSLYRKDEDYLGRHWFLNCTNTISKLIEISPLKDNEKLKENLKIYREKIYEIVAPSTHFNNVLCHGDLSIVNLLFKYDSESNIPMDCKLIDFQALRYTPPAHDVMTYIYLTADSQIRKKHLNELLEWYHLHFHHELDEHCMDKDNHVVLEMFRESCDYVLPMVILQALCYSTMIPINHYPQVKLDQGLYKNYVYGDRSPECIDIYKKGGEFKDVFDELLNIFSKL